METDPEMRSFFPDRGALVAVSSRDGPAPFASKVLLADPPRGPWKTVYESDAQFHGVTVANGFVFFFEYREQGGGASSQKLVQVDLPSGRSLVVDGYALSAATFRGGGGGPPQPTASVAFGSGLIAWVRLVEGAAGATTGELRVGLSHLPGDAQFVARSDAHIRPLAIVDATTLVYAISAERGVELRARELGSRAERVLATGQTQPGGIVPFRNSARSGSWIAWVEDSPTGSTLRAIDVKTDGTKDLSLGQSHCPGLTGNDRYLALNCSGPTPRMVLVDTGSWSQVPVAPVTPSGPFLLTAGGTTEVVWHDRPGGRQRVVRFAPTAPIASPADGPYRDLVAREDPALGYRISLPAVHRIAHSVAEPDNTGSDIYTSRSESEQVEACRVGGFATLAIADIQIVVRSNAAGAAPIDVARHALFQATEQTTIASHPAARVVRLPTGDTAMYVIGANDRLYEITPGRDVTPAGLDQIVSTFVAIPLAPAASSPLRRTLCGR